MPFIEQINSICQAIANRGQACLAIDVSWNSDMTVLQFKFAGVLLKEYERKAIASAVWDRLPAEEQRHSTVDYQIGDDILLMKFRETSPEFSAIMERLAGAMDKKEFFCEKV